MSLKQIESVIRVVPDFPPGKGIKYFYDISTLLQHAEFREATWDRMYQQIQHLPVDVVCAIDSRGFITGTSLSCRERANVSMAMVRKASKLPGEVFSVTYDLEYREGSTLQLQKGLIKPGQRVWLSDDLAATGGSLLAAIQLIQESGGVVVAASVIIDLVDLGCANKLADYGIPLYSVLQMNGNGVNMTEPIWTATTITTTLRTANDTSMIVFYHPTCRSLANSIRFKYSNDTIQIIEAAWNRYPDGSPNLDFFSDQYLIGRDVLFLGNLDDLSVVLEQQVFLIALSRQGLRSLTVSFPYLKTATDERIERPGKVAFVEPFAKLLSTSLHSTSTGPVHIQLFDVHTTPTHFNFNLDKVSVHMLSAVSIIKQIIKTTFIEITNLDSQNLVVLAFPDDGAAKRFKFLFEDVRLPTIICGKVRTGDKRFIRILEGSDFKNVRHIFVIDDLVMTGGTLHECRLVLSEAYPEAKISAYVTHPVFPNDAWRKFLPGEVYGGFSRFYVSNTISRTCNKLYTRSETFQVLDISDLIVENTFLHTRFYKKYDYLNNQPSLVYLASNNAHKSKAVRDALHNILGSSHSFRIHQYEITSNVPEQPMYREGMNGCQNRLRNLLVHVDGGGADTSNTLFVAVENGLVKTNAGDADAAFVGLCLGKTGRPFFATSPLVLPPADVVHEALAKGTTVGQILQDRYGTPKDNWHSMYDRLGRDRSTLISLAVQDAMTYYLQLHQ